MSRSIYSLLEIPGRHLQKRKAIPCSGANTTSQQHQMGGGTKRKGVLLDIFFLIIIIVRASALISFPPLLCSSISCYSPHLNTTTTAGQPEPAFCMLLHQVKAFNYMMLPDFLSEFPAVNSFC